MTPCTSSPKLAYCSRIGSVSPAASFATPFSKHLEARRRQQESNEHRASGSRRILGKLTALSDVMEEIETIRAPRRLSIRRGFVSATVDFINRIETATQLGSRVHIDLRDCVEISRSAGLLLTAQIERSIARHPGCLNGYSPNSVDVCRGLHGLGFYKHLNFLSPLDDYPGHVEDSITVCSGSGVTQDLSERLEKVAEVAEPLFEDSEFVAQVHAALNEAITNVVGHAYLMETGELPRTREHAPHEAVRPIPEASAVRPDISLDRWWFAGHADAETGELLLLALDHGGTIPSVAPFRIPDVLRAFWQEYPRIVSKNKIEPSDAAILEAVAKARRQKIGTGRRGRGFPTMIGLVENFADSGSVTVLSGAALYEFTMVKGSDRATERSFSLSKSFHGTLIEWRIATSAERTKGGMSVGPGKNPSRD